jgi:hypothetical protein
MTCEVNENYIHVMNITNFSDMTFGCLCNKRVDVSGKPAASTIRLGSSGMLRENCYRTTRNHSPQERNIYVVCR